MSRSYKKSPVYTDHDRGVKSWKRQANKTIRRYKKEVPKGKGYKKLYNSYSIHDYKCYWTKQDSANQYYSYLKGANGHYWMMRADEEYKDVNDYIEQNWRKYYQMK